MLITPQAQVRGAQKPPFPQKPNILIVPRASKLSIALIRLLEKVGNIELYSGLEEYSALSKIDNAMKNFDKSVEGLLESAKLWIEVTGDDEISSLNVDLVELNKLIKSAVLFCTPSQSKKGV